MNPIETEPAIRELELMLGPECMRRGRVPQNGIIVTRDLETKPEFVLERFVTNPDGTVTVEHPNAKGK